MKKYVNKGSEEQIVMVNGHTHLLTENMRYEEDEKWIKYTSRSIDKKHKYKVELRKKYIISRTYSPTISF